MISTRRTRKIKHSFYFVSVGFLTFMLLSITALHAQETQSPPLSGNSKMCLGCHSRFTPGIVEDWQTSRHLDITPNQALQQPPLERRISTEVVPEELARYAVGCYECHSLNTDQHTDSFEHMGMKIQVVVSPQDCQICHPAEVRQYCESKKAYAYTNLLDNPVYHTLVSAITGVKAIGDAGEITTQEPTQDTLNGSCLGCHGTKVEVEGIEEISTKMGRLNVPKLKNWPSQGVGRINPDGSRGSCTSCHTRHAFSIAEARKPYTCSQCHGEPDVPAWPVYKVSKHGTIFATHQDNWDFEAVPWKVGADFIAPTCAACHNSLIASPDKDKITERTHDFGSRLSTRIFGLLYSHPQPKSGDTTVIKNADELPLPTTFLGKPAQEFLIDENEQQARLAILKSVCQGCHATDWTAQHFARFDQMAADVDQMVLTSTALMAQMWGQQLADQANPFDEAIEQLWIKQWLFFANTVRYAAAMTGAQKYAAFTDGWWDLTHTLQEMKDWMKLHTSE